MSILGDDDGLLGSTPTGTENNNISALGRISGKLLTADLLRNGVDLTFRNATASPDLLYLDVTNMRVGVEGKRTLPATLARASGSLPVYDLDVNDTIRTNIFNVPNQANIDNLTLNANGEFRSITGPLNIKSSDVYAIFEFKQLESDFLTITNNRINSITNKNIKLDPNGTGRVVFEANTAILGDVLVTGNITASGNLSSQGTIYVGDNPLDTVTIVPDFTQSIIPGTDITYDLGKSNKRWAQIYSPDWTNIGTAGSGLRPQSVIVSNQMLIDGVANKISGIQSNEDIELLPDTGITYIERTSWQDDTITNLNNTPLTFASTGIGYTRFMGDNGILIPAGNTAEQRLGAELGETRWNTDLEYLECFDGTVWVVSTGGGETVTAAFMEDLGNVYALILG